MEGFHMRIIDISMTIHHNMPVYKNIEAKRPVHTIEKRIPPDSVNESALCLNLHTGTHIDSPFHMLQGGYPTEQLNLASLITRCKVVDLTSVEDGISESDLVDLGIEPGDFLLFKTRNSFEEDFNPAYIYLKACGARYLAKKQIKGVGIDSLGIERAQPDHETHAVLLKQEIIIIEGLQLKDVAAGQYTMIALPLKIRNADGAPARVVLIDGPIEIGNQHQSQFMD
jgi:arylformamidase